MRRNRRSDGRPVTDHTNASSILQHFCAGRRPGRLLTRTDRGREDGVRPGKAKDGGIDLPRLVPGAKQLGHVDRRQA